MLFEAQGGLVQDMFVLKDHHCEQVLLFGLVQTNWDQIEEHDRQAYCVDKKADDGYSSC